MQRSANQILMIRPASFGFNIETGATNVFQNKVQKDAQQIAVAAQSEFDELVNKIKTAGVSVLVIADTPTPIKPDAVFPNNWLATMAGTVITFPMITPNRRIELRQDIVDNLQNNFGLRTHLQLENFGNQEMFLEGTGSIVMDHFNKIAYACLGPRTHPEPLREFCNNFGYQSLTFEANFKGKPIYHTNVMLAIGEKFAVVCLESVATDEQKQNLKQSLKQGGKQIVAVTLDQMANFACNIIELENANKEKVIIMSEKAKHSFTKDQLKTLTSYGKIVSSPLPTIESVGGGSARCMIAEVFA